MLHLFARLFLGIFLIFMLGWTVADQLTETANHQQILQEQEAIFALRHESLKPVLSMKDPKEREAALLARSDGSLYTITLALQEDLALTDAELAVLRSGEPVIQVHMGEWYDEVEIFLADAEPGKIIVFRYGEKAGEITLAYYQTMVWWIFSGIALVLIFMIIPLVRRLKNLEVAARAFGSGDLQARVPSGGAAAIARLGDTFNRMAQQLTQARHRQNIMTHAVSHEVRTPLARLRLSLDMMEDMGLQDELRTFVTDMHRDIDDLEQLSDEMLRWAKLSHEQIHLETVDLSRLIQTCRESFLRLHPDLVVSYEGPEVMLCRANGPMLERALENLLSNGQKYGAKKMQIALAFTEGMVSITLDDDGPGIPEALREAVLLAFARLETRQKGFGLGMAIVALIAEAHNGKISLHESPWSGLRVCLRWPHNSPGVASGKDLLSGFEFKKNPDSAPADKP